jgi:tetratricopeptide (TPR) repeat protein
MAKAWRALGVAESETDVARGEEAAANALRHALLSDDTAEQELALMDWVIGGLIGSTPIPEALSRAESALARPGLSRLVQANLGVRRAHMLAAHGELKVAVKLGIESVEMMRQLGSRLDLIFSLLSMGAVHLLANNFAQAEATFREADSHSVAIGERGLRPHILARVAEALAEQGRDGEAAEACDAAREHAFEGDPLTEVICGVTSARLLANAGRLSDAIDALRALVPIAASTNRPTTHAYALAAYGTALMRGERLPEARAALQGALEINERKGNVVAARQVRERLEQVAAAEGNP